MTQIRTVGLTKIYGDVIAVDHLDLDIQKGELFSLLGVNGAGKSTTIKLLSCLATPTCGEAFVGGSSTVTDMWSVKAQIGLSPQETAVAANLTVEENLRLMCRIYGLSGSVGESRLNQVVEQLSLAPVLSRRAGKLSGGMKRRLSIAMALIHQPSVLFLDEPTLGLDVIARRELWDVIRSLQGKVTIILTTHYMEEAEALSHRIGIMKAGRLLTVGTARELMEQTGTNRFEDAFISIVKEGVV